MQDSSFIACELLATMQKLNGEVVERIFALAKASFTDSVSNGKANLKELQLGALGTSYRAGLPDGATIDAALAMAMAELHGKHSFNNFEEAITAAWKHYDALNGIAAQDGTSAEQLNDQIADELAVLRTASTTYVEWNFTLGLCKPKLARNGVALMRYVAPLLRMIELRVLGSVQPALLAGLCRAQKQDRVL
jgi:hypothetical protein